MKPFATELSHYLETDALIRAGDQRDPLSSSHKELSLRKTGTQELTKPLTISTTQPPETTDYTDQQTVEASSRRPPTRLI